MGDNIDSIYRNDPNYSNIILRQQINTAGKLRDVREFIEINSVDVLLQNAERTMPEHIRAFLRDVANHAVPLEVQEASEIPDADRRVMRSFYMGELLGVTLATNCLPNLDEFAPDMDLLFPDGAPFSEFSHGEHNRDIHEHFARVASIAEEACPDIMELVQDVETELSAADFIEVRLGAAIMLSLWIEQFLEQRFIEAQAEPVHTFSDDVLWAEFDHYNGLT